MGRGGLVLLSGEAGLGKTTLAEALCREARGALVLVGRCYDLSETPPYGPWADLFARYQPADGPMPPGTFRHGDISGTVTSQAELFNQTRDFLIALSAPRPVL